MFFFIHKWIKCFYALGGNEKVSLFCVCSRILAMHEPKKNHENLLDILSNTIINTQSFKKLNAIFLTIQLDCPEVLISCSELY